MADERIAHRQTGQQKHQPDRQTLPAFIHQPSEFQPVQPGPVGEVVVHGLFDQWLRLLFRRQLAEMHNEDDRGVYRKLPDPAQDELLVAKTEGCT